MLAFARRRAVKITFDVIIFITFIALFITREGDFGNPERYLQHSWIGIVAIPIIAVHMTGNWGWIMRLIKRGRQDRQFGLGVLNAVFFALVAICTITGFPAWWDVAGFATPHQITGLLAVLVMFIHIGWNIRPFRQLFST
ncbi:MAG: hypothetical protein AAF467_01870 [Actinomycetota bacterium]